MRVRMLVRLTLTVAGAALALGTGLAGSASAATVTGGSTTLTTAPGLAGALVGKGIVGYPTAPATGSCAGGGSFRATFPVTGGDADFAGLTGTVRHAGGLKIVNLRARKSVTLTNLEVSLTDFQLTAQVSGSSARLAVLDLGGASFDPSGNSLTADAVTLTAAAATALNRALSSTAFTPGLAIGSLTTTVTVAAAAG